MKLSDVLRTLFNDLKVQSWVDHSIYVEEGAPDALSHLFHLRSSAIHWVGDASLTNNLLSWLETHQSHNCEFSCEDGYLFAYCFGSSLDQLPTPFDFITSLDRAIFSDPLFDDIEFSLSSSTPKTSSMYKAIGLFSRPDIANGYRQLLHWTSLKDFSGCFVAYYEGRSSHENGRGITLGYLSDKAYLKKTYAYQLSPLAVCEEGSSDLKASSPVTGLERSWDAEGVFSMDGFDATLSKPKPSFIRMSTKYLQETSLFMRLATDLEMKNLREALLDDKIKMLQNEFLTKEMLLEQLERQSSDQVEFRSIDYSGGH